MPHDHCEAQLLSYEESSLRRRLILNSVLNLCYCRKKLYFNIIFAVYNHLYGGCLNASPHNQHMTCEFIRKASTVVDFRSVCRIDGFSFNYVFQFYKSFYVQQIKLLCGNKRSFSTIGSCCESENKNFNSLRSFNGIKISFSIVRRSLIILFFTFYAWRYCFVDISSYAWFVYWYWKIEDCKKVHSIQIRPFRYFLALLFWCFFYCRRCCMFKITVVHCISL